MRVKHQKYFRLRAIGRAIETLDQTVDKFKTDLFNEALSGKPKYYEVVA
jgi:hypothetical protein